MARWFGLPVSPVRVVFAVLTVLTLGVAGLLYLLAWLVAPTTIRRRWTGALAVLGLTAVGALGGYHQLTTRGAVTAWQDARGDAGHPLVSADVVLIEGDHVAAWTRTDSQGRFRFWHPPGGRRGRALAICARGVQPYFAATASSAVVSSGYGPSAYAPGFPLPAELLRVDGLPTSCRRPAP